MLQRNHKRYCRGSSMVEMAIVVVLFFMLVFAIIEFSLAIFYANRLIEATRAGARYAVVSDPLIAGLKNYDCAALPVDYTACDTSTPSCVGLHQAMNGTVIIPIENIYYKYKCTAIDGGAGIRVYTISIKVNDMSYYPILPNLFVLDGASGDAAGFGISMPSFETTRTSEDQFGY